MKIDLQNLCFSVVSSSHLANNRSSHNFSIGRLQMFQSTTTPFLDPVMQQKMAKGVCIVKTQLMLTI